VRGGVDEERKERHVEDDRLGVEQRDEEGLARVAARLDAHRRSGRVTAREQQLQADPTEVERTGELHRAEHLRVRRQQRRDARDREPQQHLIAGDEPECRGCAGAKVPGPGKARNSRIVAQKAGKSVTPGMVFGLSNEPLRPLNASR
jgi:hypothetical protein